MVMGFTSNNNWGSKSMGFLLVFFPEDHQSHQKSRSFSRSNSNLIALILYRSQFSVAICLLLLFAAVLLVTLSTLPPSSSSPSSSAPASRGQFSSNFPLALQGMGILYRRGTRAMPDLVVAHASESLTHHELGLFVRLFLRSSLAADSDLVVLFASKSSAFDDVILRENNSFLKLLAEYSKDSQPTSSFNVTQFIEVGEKERESGEPIWGRRRIRANFTGSSVGASTRPSYGSVVGFDVDELDPENSLSGFLDNAPMSLRRWACYPMLLGRVRRNFKHVLLADMKEILLLGDPLIRVRTQSLESLFTTQLMPPKDGRRNPTRTKPAYPGLIMGGSRGVRRLSNEMLTAIVRASAQQHRKKNQFTESGIFNQLTGGEFALRNVNLVASTESVPELSSALKSGLFVNNYSVTRRGNGNYDLDRVLMKHLCSFPVDSTVYSDCQD